MPFSTIFLRSVPEAHRARFAAIADLDERLSEIIAAARNVWTEVDLPDDAFLEFLGRRVPEEFASDLTALHTDDLYIACAYGRGVPGAYAALEQHAMRRVGLALGRLHVPANVADDIAQDLRRRVVEMQDPACGQKLYVGRGDLVGCPRAPEPLYPPAPFPRIRGKGEQEGVAPFPRIRGKGWGWGVRQS